jgi:protein-tyrosine phosphatase
MTADPTAFPIQFDPREQRMRGTAIHGNTPFDVPFVSKITDNLWQGGCENGLVLPSEVVHVVSLYPWEAYKVCHELQSHLSVRLYDDLAGPDREQMMALARWINVCRKTGVTLVHCQAGLNRSGLLAGLALVLEGRSPIDAVALLRSTRSPAVLCNPVFEDWLLSFSEPPS